MRRYRWQIVCAACLLGLVALWGTASPGQPPAAKARETWEYKTLTLYEASDGRVNEAGAEGWELVAVTSRGANLLFTFKRAK